MQRIDHDVLAHPLHTWPATRALEASARGHPAAAHPDAARRPGHGPTGAGHRAACPHLLDRLRPRQQRRRRPGSRHAPATLGQDRAGQLAGQRRDGAGRRARLARARRGRRRAASSARRPPNASCCIDALLGIGARRAAARPAGRLDRPHQHPAGAGAGRGPAVWLACRHRRCRGPLRARQPYAEPAHAQARPVHGPRARPGRPGLVRIPRCRTRPARQRKPGSAAHRRPPRVGTPRTRAATAMSPSSAARPA